MSSRPSEEEATLFVVGELVGHITRPPANLALEYLHDEVSALLWQEHNRKPDAPLIPISDLKPGLPYLGPLRVVRGSPTLGVMFGSMLGHSAKQGVSELFRRMCHTRPFVRELDMENLVIAGGFVTACLSGAVLPEQDVDIFVYGLDAGRARRKADEIFERALKFGADEVRHIITPQAITIEIRQLAYQIILTLNDSPAACLRSFDLGSCAVGVYMSSAGDLRAETTALGAFALERRANIADVAKCHPAYGTRVAKYLQRGFGLVLPDALEYAELCAGSPSFVRDHVDSRGRWGASESDEFRDSGSISNFQFTLAKSLSSGVLPRIWSHERRLSPRVLERENVGRVYEELAGQIVDPHFPLRCLHKVITVLEKAEVRRATATINDVGTRKARIEHLMRAQCDATLRQTLEADYTIRWETAQRDPGLTLDAFYGSSLRRSTRLLGDSDEKRELLAELFAKP